MRLKCFSERAVSFTTSQWFVTSLVLELALPIDLNPRLTVLIKFVLIKEKKCSSFGGRGSISRVYTESPENSLLSNFVVGQSPT